MHLVLWLPQQHSRCPRNISALIYGNCRHSSACLCKQTTYQFSNASRLYCLWVQTKLLLSNNTRQYKYLQVLPSMQYHRAGFVWTRLQISTCGLWVIFEFCFIELCVVVCQWNALIYFAAVDHKLCLAQLAVTWQLNTISWYETLIRSVAFISKELTSNDNARRITFFNNSIYSVYTFQSVTKQRDQWLKGGSTLKLSVELMSAWTVIAQWASSQLAVVKLLPRRKVT